MVRRLAELLALVAVFCIAGVAEAGSASGTFAVGKLSIAPKHAVAYPVRDPRDPRKRAIELVLSEGFVDPIAAVAAIDPHTHVINQEGVRSGNYILFWVRPDGEVGMNATFAKTMMQYVDGTRGLSNGLVADLSANTADRIAGRIRTREPMKTRNGETYRLDVVFTTAVTNPPPGKALEADGGEPGRALVALGGAIEHRDWNAIRGVLAKATLERFVADYRSDEENLGYAIDILQAWLPKKALRVTGGEQREESAMLDVEGEPWPGRVGLYVAHMIREDGAWRFESATLAGILPPQPKSEPERSKNQEPASTPTP